MKNDTDSKGIPSFVLRYGILIAVGVAVIFTLQETSQFRRQFQEGDRRTALLQNIPAGSIGRIEIYDGAYSNRRMDIIAVNSPSSKALFANAMHDLSDYEPNRDQRTQDFFIQMQTVDGLTHQFEVWLKPGAPGVAFLYMVERSFDQGRIHDKHLGARKSAGLYKWLEHHQLVK